jgi:hypothetical protein
MENIFKKRPYRPLLREEALRIRARHLEGATASQLRLEFDRAYRLIVAVLEGSHRSLRED